MWSSVFKALGNRRCVVFEDVYMCNIKVVLLKVNVCFTANNMQCNCVVVVFLHQ